MIAQADESSTNPHGLQIDPLEQARAAELAAEAAVLDAAEGQAWIGADHVVDEAAAGVELIAGDRLAARAVAREHGGTEAKLARVGERERVGFVAGAQDRGDGAEQLLDGGGRAGADVIEQGDRIEVAGAARHATAEAQLLNYDVTVAVGDIATNRHCTGQGLTSFFECLLFPSSISFHDVEFLSGGEIAIPNEPDYGGSWSQPDGHTLEVTYVDLISNTVVAEFVGYGTNASCFEGITTFPGSAYISPYEVCL